MSPARAWALVATLLVATLALLAAPWTVAIAVGAGALALMPQGRRGFVAAAGLGVAIHVAILSLVIPGDPHFDLGPLPWSLAGARLGLEGSLRVVAVLALNLAALQRVGAARLVDALALPPRATALLAAVLLAAHDVGRDFARLRMARRVEGEWPRGRLARAREAARLLPALLVAAHRRASARRDALRLVGHATGPRFVPIVAVAALAAAGRLALLALPNVALTYVVVFLGGILYGARAGILGGALGMLATDLLLTGLYPLGLVNVPAMALLGLFGGLARPLVLGARSPAERATTTLLAASAGLGGTFLFSLGSDTLTWLLVARGAAEAWLPIVLAGLAFNVIPALVNAVVFAAAVGPVVRGFEAAGLLAPPSDPDPRPAPTEEPTLS